MEGRVIISGNASHQIAEILTRIVDTDPFIIADALPVQAIDPQDKGQDNDCDYRHLAQVKMLAHWSIVRWSDRQMVRGQVVSQTKDRLTTRPSG